MTSDITPRHNPCKGKAEQNAKSCGREANVDARNEKRQCAVEHIRRGATIAQAARAVGLSRPALASWMHRNNIHGATRAEQIAARQKAIETWASGVVAEWVEPGAMRTWTIDQAIARLADRLRRERADNITETDRRYRALREAIRNRAVVEMATGRQQEAAQ